MTVYTTFILKDKLNCNDMANYVSELGTVSLVRSNISTQQGLEYGCQIVQSVLTKDHIKNS